MMILFYLIIIIAAIIIIIIIASNHYEPGIILKVFCVLPHFIIAENLLGRYYIISI